MGYGEDEMKSQLKGGMMKRVIVRKNETYDGHEDEDHVPPVGDHFEREPPSEVDRKIKGESGFYYCAKTDF
jgi:hypothetical protein